MISEHPLYEEWDEALENLKDAHEAFKSGKANKGDLKKAQRKYDEIADRL